MAKKRSATSTTVPLASAAGRTGVPRPPSTASVQALSSPHRRVVMVNLATAPIEGRASPRKPRVAMASRSPVLEVQWRSTASARSSAPMPDPSSEMRMKEVPPSRAMISIDAAPASTALSISSRTTEAGRSTTSPAAMRLMRVSSRRMTGMAPI